MSPAPEPVGVDVGTTGGDWLFKQGDLLLGPVPARVLVDKLYRGEINGKTPIAREGEDSFVPIEQVDFFKVHAKKAQVKVQLERDSQIIKLQQQRKRTFKLSAFGVLGLAVLGGGAYAAYYLAVHKPWRHTNEADMVAIELEPPTIAFNDAHRSDDGVVLNLPDPSTVPAAATGGTLPKHGTRFAKHTPTPGSGPQNQPAEPDGLQTGPKFDSSSVTQAANAKASTLHPCIRQEALTHPGEPGAIQFEFSVANDGRVGQIWVDSPEYKSGPLYECLVKTVKGWSFPRYEGEQANVTLKFKWGTKS